MSLLLLFNQSAAVVPVIPPAGGGANPFWTREYMEGIKRKIEEEDLILLAYSMIMNDPEEM
jgi:hypothetical protein